MQLDMLSFDFGTLPRSLDMGRRITNPTELFWCAEWESLLRLCNTNRQAVGNCASDYDRFLAICQACSMTVGHPLRAWFLSVLQEKFDIDEIPSEENAAKLWQILSQALLQAPISKGELLAKGHCLCGDAEPPKALPSGVKPMPSLNLLLNAPPQSREAWRAQIEHTICTYREAGGEQVLLQVDLQGEVVIPDLYHAEAALRATNRTKKQQALLVAQLMREVGELCITHKMRLLVWCQGDTKPLASLLRYVERSVGLPEMCWITNDSRYVDEMLRYQASESKADLYWGICVNELQTGRELEETMDSAAARYPIGRLKLFTACDFSVMPFVQKSLAERAEAWLGKKR